jgi:two-component system nitrogen regulation sensor histidine kinase GlnL
MNLQIKKASQQSAFSWENILTSLEEAVLVIDQHGKISFLNQAAESLTGTSSSQVTQQPYESVFARNPWLLDMVKKNQPPQHNSTHAEGDLVTKRGRPVPVSLAVTSLQDPNGRCVGTVLLLRNLTHRKEMEEHLMRSDRLALLGTVAAGLAHEIKNPLGGIKGASQLLRREVANDPSLVECTDIVIREVDRINQILEQLLDLSRPPKLQMDSLNIHELLDHVLFLERQALSRGNVVIEKKFDPSLPPIRGDRAQLIQVFLNLVKNSLEALDGRGCLTISTRIETDYHIRTQGSDRGNFIRVDIEDNGPGIKEEHLPNIFSPFFTTKSSGTGLGLAICHRIIKEHGGLIQVESREGQGAALKVSLVVTN